MAKITPEIKELETSIANVPGHNYMINGSLDFWQRGTSVTGTGYNTDRISSNGNSVVVSRITGPTGFEFGLRHKFNTTGGGAFNNLFSFIESASTRQLHDKFVTVSMWMRKGSNLLGTYSMKLGQHTIEAANGGEGTYGTTDITGSLTTSWQRFSFTTNATISTAALSFGWSLRYDSTVIDANNYVDIAGIKIEVGETATPWSRHGGSVAAEFSACQRYYYRNNPTLNGLNNAWIFHAFNTGDARGGRNFPTTMRAVPIVTLYNNGGAPTGVHDVPSPGDITGVTAGNLNETGIGNISKTAGWSTTSMLLANVEADAEL